MLYEKVKEYAAEANIPIYKLEQKIGVAPGAISKWRYHSPSIEKVVAVARELDVTVNDLTSGEQ